MKNKTKQKGPKRLRFIYGETYVGLKVFGLYVYFSKAKMKRNTSTDLRKSFRRELFRERGLRCECCGKVLDESVLTVHHIKKRSEYPELTYDKSNVQQLCVRCHKELHQREDLLKGFTYQGQQPQPQPAQLPTI